DDIESISVIWKSGRELLCLINDILDLSKIEAGQMSLTQEDITIAELLAELKSTFSHLAEEKGLLLDFIQEEGVPKTFRADRKRVDQILKNLLANAVKFTQHGKITVSVALSLPPSSDEKGRLDIVSNNISNSIAIAVQDSGVGIPLDKQKIIFEAFQQADGSTARKYGGTGLGLSISKELAELLGGKICMESEEGEGTTFTLYLPLSESQQEESQQDGQDGQYKKSTPEENKKQEEKQSNVADEQDEKHEKIRKLLVAGQEAEQRKAVITLIGNNDVQSQEAGSGQEVLEHLAREHYDCLVMGLDFPDMSGLSLLQQLKDTQMALPPIIIYTDKKLSREATGELRQYARSIIIKGVMSEERLLDEASLLLHCMVSNLPEVQQRMIRNLHEDDAIFQGKRILLVDDDMRNVFALAKVLRDRGMITIKAEDGIRALEILDQEEVDLVLMDIMMPIMDGYETIKNIREQPQYDDLPVIALTAKAMQDDRRRCLEAGANDYLAKPVEPERLLALLRLWLYF
ncbi:MAG: response regulator, partial [Candidatus Electrothrix sp. MAN1_4]|nr:response regulator [Candidatus Electrothrix sp. MAN1_4]